MPSFWNCFNAAHYLGLPFKYFSLVPGEESFVYNPLRQEVHQRFTAMQRAELFTQSAGTDYGEVYGGAYFQAKAEMALCNYLTNYTDPPLEDFIELFKLFNDKYSYANIGHVDDWTDASHFRALFARLASVSSLNGTPRNLNKPDAHANAMECFELLRTPAIYYFKLPASAGRNAGRFVARSVLQNLFASAGFRSSAEQVPVVAVLDEFQELVGPSIDVFLEQCRSRGISCVLAHQSIHQLERNNVNLLPVIQACTSTHIVVEASDAKSVEYVQQRSGKAYFALMSWAQEAPSADSEANCGVDTFRPSNATTADGQGIPLVNVREEVAWRLDENSIYRVSADPTAAFVVVKKNGGFSNLDGFLVPIRSFFHVPKDVFDRRGKELWPQWDRPKTVLVKMSSPFARKAANGASPETEPIKIVAPPPRSNTPSHGRLHPRGPQPGQGE